MDGGEPIGQARPVEVEHPLVRDERDGAVARDELVQAPDGAVLDDDSGESEHDALEIGGHGIRRLAVDGLALGVEGAEALLVLRQRAIRGARAGPRLVRVDRQQHGEGASRERLPGLRAHDRAAAESEHGRLQPIEQLPRQLGLGGSEPELAPLVEQLADRRALPALELVVHVDEGPLEQPRERRAGGRLPGPHETDEGDVPACQRSRRRLGRGGRRDPTAHRASLSVCDGAAARPRPAARAWSGTDSLQTRRDPAQTRDETLVTLRERVRGPPTRAGGCDNPEAG